MPEKISANIPETLNHFLVKTDQEYQEELSSLALFNVAMTREWSDHQKQSFAAIFYHLRGHFINFAWYIANFTTNENTKTLILNNMKEELGVGSRFSHELLYERFAKECHVDIHNEIIHETNYLPFAKEFNKSHLQWISVHDQDERLAAFAAYERLDNIDYPHLLNMAKSLGLSQQALAFFNVHVHVDHFDSTLELLMPIWEQNPNKVKRSFEFIYSNQLRMWRQLANQVFSDHFKLNQSLEISR